MARTKAPSFPLRVLLPAAFWLGVWQLAALVVDAWLGGRGSTLFLPYPAAVLSALGALAGQGEFWLSVCATLLRVAAGMCVGTALGVALALLTCAAPPADLIFSPAIRVVRATPVASFILLVVLWADKSFVPVVIAALIVLPVIWGSLTHGIRAVDPKLLELGDMLRFSRGKKLRLIVLPSAMPYLRSGVSTAMGLAWKSGVAAEALCLPRRAIGTAIYSTKFYLETPALFAWTLSVILLSLGLEKALSAWLGRERKP